MIIIELNIEYKKVWGGQYTLSFISRGFFPQLSKLDG